jgi:hypothetical protein
VLIDEGAVDRFLFETDRNSVDLADLVSTDDNMSLEYATPKTNVPSADDIPDTIGYLGGYKTRRTCHRADMNLRVGLHASSPNEVNLPQQC